MLKSPKTFYGISLFASVLVIIIAVFDLQQDFERRLETLKTQQTQFAKVISEHAERSLEAVKITVALISEDLKTMGNWSEKDEFDLHMLLKNSQIESLPQSRDLIIFDQAGRQFARSTKFPTNSISSVSDRTYFKANESGISLFVSPPFQGRNSGKWTFAVTSRINDRTGEFDGVVFSAIEPAYFRNFHQKIAPFNRFVSLLMDANGVITMSTDDADDLSAFHSGQNFFKDLKFGEQFGLEKSQSFIETDQWLVLTRVIPNSSMHIAVAVSKEEVLRGWRNQMIRSSLFTALLVGLFLFVGFLASRRIRQSESRYDILFNEMSSGFFHSEIIMNDQGMPIDYRYLAVNPEFEKLTGMPKEHVIGQTVQSVFPEMESIWIEKFSQVALSGQPIHFKGYSKSLDKFLECYAFSPGKNEFAVTFTDVSAREKSQIALLKAKEEAERANKAKSTFLAAASHDLRQPLHTIIMFSAVLRNALDLRKAEIVDKASMVADRIESSVMSLDDLLSKLLDISKLDAGIVEKEISPFRVQDILDSVYEIFSPLAEAKHLEFKIVNCDAMVSSDPVLLERVIHNFVSNAIRYTHQGKILIGCRKKNEGLSFEVHDTGEGIAPSDQEMIFEEFQQVGNPARQKKHGLGLGLSIARRTALLLEHDIQMHSIADKGSVFSVLIPLYHVKKKRDSFYVSVPRSQISAKGKTILVLEDDQEVQEGNVMVLQANDFQVIAASSPQEALEKCKAHQTDIDLLLLDYQLAGDMNGLQFYTHVKMELGLTFPTVFVSGNIDPEAIRQIRNSGCAYLSKPVNPNELLHKVMSMLE